MACCLAVTRLVAAFDHRDIFIDPLPDPAVSFAERLRMFNLPRSSWQDYDESLRLAGSGVFSRSLKAIPLALEVQALLDLDKASHAVRGDDGNPEGARRPPLVWRHRRLSRASGKVTIMLAIAPMI